ncbi:MAG TPA: DUF58 domain-containing protein [Planctomycetota bacterium]|nr:DUF58 domain-containing protein [Planctomycetota bacterium]
MHAPSELLPPEALSRLVNLGLTARWIVEGFIAGLHASPFHGFSVEFAEYRQYVPGDDLKHFDWKALARSDRMYVKKYHSETNTRAHVLLDCSASMGFGEPVTKLRYGAAIAAAISYLMMLQQDAAGAVLFSDRVLRYVRPRSAMTHFRELAQALDSARPATTTNAAQALHELAETVKARGLFVLVSDLHDDLEKVVLGLRHLRFKGHEVLLFHVLDKDEVAFPYRTLSEFKDLETGERIQVHPQVVRADYHRALDAFTDRMRRECSAMKVDYQLVDTKTPFDDVLARYLDRRRRLG